MKGGTKVVLVALAAGVAGVLMGLLVSGPGPLLRTELGQRLLGAALSRSAPPPPRGVRVASRGGAIPAFTLPDRAGHPVAIPAAYAGRPLLLNVWASWCGPCVREMPVLSAYAAAQGPNGVQVVGIALDDPAEVEAFLRRVPVAYPVLVDAPGPADAGVRLGNPRGVLPYSVLVSADGRLLRQRIGPFAEGEIPAWAGN